MKTCEIYTWKLVLSRRSLFLVLSNGPLCPWSKWDHHHCFNRHNFSKNIFNYDTKIMLNSITFVSFSWNLWNGLLHMSHPKLFNDTKSTKRRLSIFTKQIKKLFKHIDYYLDKVKFFEHENLKNHVIHHYNVNLD